MLEELLAQEEGKTLEFKENADSLSKIIQTIVAFANTAGGTIVVGVQDKTKKVVGLENALVDELKISNAVATSVEPLLVPTLQLSTYRNKDVLIITVPHCFGPFYVKSLKMKNGTFIRLGPTNRPADMHTINEIVNFKENKYFDESPNIRATVDDIDFESAKKLFAKKKKKFTSSTAQSLGITIHHNGALYPSNGGLLLFAHNVGQFFPDAEIRLVRFLGDDKTEALDYQDVHGPLTAIIDQIIAFIRRNTAMSAKIGEIYRENIPQYPPVVVREAVTNALLHADYSKKTPIQVAIFDNRIEIINPGGLLFGLTLDTALSGVSQLRNRVIGRVFRELDFIEQWGSGLKNMIKISEELGIQSPKFEDLSTFFRVTLYGRTNQETVKDHDHWKERTIKHLKRNEKLTAKQAQKLWGVTPRTTSSRLKELIKEGLITEIGINRYDPQKYFKLTKS